MLEILSTMTENRYIFFLGSHPVLSGSEAYRLLRLTDISPRLIIANEKFIIVETAKSMPTDFLGRLGGTERIALIIAEKVDVITSSYIANILLAQQTSTKKLVVGFSNLGVGLKYPPRLGLEVKRRLQDAGHSVRIILPKKGSTRLNAAQVIFNKLLSEPNGEYTIVHEGKNHYLGRTIQVQNISKYELRDTKRPARDAKIGMLPPKLAQIMLNIGTSVISETRWPIIWDPFCGLGTIVQEGWLKNYRMIGSDKSAAMTAATKMNCDYLASHFSVRNDLAPILFAHDITLPVRSLGLLDAIVTEPYLGKPLHAPLSSEEAVANFKLLENLYLAIFRSGQENLKPGGSITLALPAYRKRKRLASWHLFPPTFLDAITKIGYRRIQLIPKALQLLFNQTQRESLIYARADALVGREITLWIRESKG